MKSIINTAVLKDQVHLWWIGQSGFFIKLPNEKIVLVDAYLSDSVERKNPLFVRQTPKPLLPGEIMCDYYLCTHNHLDHTDPDTINGIKNKESILFIGPRNCVTIFRQSGIPDEQIILLEAGQHIQLHGFSVTATFCIPNGADVLDSVGFLIQAENSVTIYLSGDTDYHDFLQYIKHSSVDAAVVCINGKFGNLNIRQAYELVQHIDAKVAIPSHFDMFRMNSEEPQAFAALFKTSGRCLVPRIGSPIIIHAGTLHKTFKSFTS